MSGTELLTRSRDVSPESVRVLLTAFTDADALMDSINAANIYHFILKPWDPKELTHTVRRGVERYRLARERDALLRDLAAKNRDLEATLADLRAAQERVVREASVRAQLQRYVSPRLVELALANPTLLELAGDWREATVLFADIRGFTAPHGAHSRADGRPAPRRVLQRDDRRDLPSPGDRRAAHRRRDRGPLRRHRRGPRRRDARGADRRRHGRQRCRPSRPAGAPRGFQPSTSGSGSARDRCGPPPSAPTAAGS